MTTAEEVQAEIDANLRVVNKNRSQSGNINTAIGRIAQAVVEHPNIVAFFQYLNYVKNLSSAETALSNIALDVFDARVLYETTPKILAPRLVDVVDNKKVFFSTCGKLMSAYAEYQAAYSDFVSASAPVNWIQDGNFVGSLVTASDAAKSAYLNIVPRKISSSVIILPALFSIKCSGNTAAMSYNGAAINIETFITKGCSILKSEVLSIDNGVARLADTVQGTTTEFAPTGWNVGPKRIQLQYSEDPNTFMQNILLSGINIDTANSSVKKCIRLLNFTTIEPVVSASVYFDSTTTQQYKKISDICNSCQVPFLLDIIIKKGFNFVDWKLTASPITNISNVTGKLSKALSSGRVV